MNYKNWMSNPIPNFPTNILSNVSATRFLILLFVLLTSFGNIASAQNTQVDAVVYYVLSSHDDNGTLQEYENMGCFARYFLPVVEARMNEAKAFMATQGFDLDFCYQIVCDDNLFWNINAYSSTDHYNPNALNIYVKNDGQQVPAVGINRISVFNMNPNSGENVIVHEIGHALGLPHTDEDSWTLDANTKTWTTTASIDGDSGKELGITDTYPAPSKNQSQNSPVGFGHAVFNDNECRYVVDPSYTLLDANGFLLDYNSPGASDLHANPMQQTYCDLQYFSPQQLAIMQNEAQAYSNSAFAGGGNSIPPISAFVQQGEEMIIDFDTHIEGPLIVEGTLRILNAKVFMNPNSSIVVREGGELIMWAADLKGGTLSCMSASNDPWIGIIVSSGSTASIFDCEISGAQLGLRVSDAGKIKVHNSIFDDNGITWIARTDNAGFSSCLFFNTKTIVSNSQNAQFISSHFMGDNGQILPNTVLEIHNEASVAISGPVDYSIFENYRISMEEGSNLSVSNTIFSKFSTIFAVGSELDISNSIFENVPEALNQMYGELTFEDNIILDETQWATSLFLNGISGSITGNYFDVLNVGNVLGINSYFEELTCNHFNSGNSYSVEIFDPLPWFTSIGSPGENAGNKFNSPQAIYVSDPNMIDYYHGTHPSENINLFQTAGINPIEEINGKCSQNSFFWNFHNPECGKRDINGNFVEDEICCKTPLKIYVGCPGSKYYAARMATYMSIMRRFPECVELHEFCNPEARLTEPQEETQAESKDQDLVRVYPNPTHDIVTIDLAKDYQEEFTVVVFNTMGQELMRKRATGSQFNLDLGAYSTGIYNILITVNDEVVTSKKIVLTKD